MFPTRRFPGSRTGRPGLGDCAPFFPVPAPDACRRLRVGRKGTRRALLPPFALNTLEGVMAMRALLEKLDALERRYEEIERELARPEVASDFHRVQ